MTPRRLGGPGLLIGVLFAAGCLGEPTASGARRGSLALAPVFESPSAVAQVAHVRVRLTRPTSGAAVVDEVFDVAPGATSVDITVVVALTSASEDFLLYVDVLDAAGQTLFRNDPYPRRVTVTAGGGSATPVAVLLRATVASVVVTPVTATLAALGATQVFTAVALDVSGNQLPRSFAWSSSDANVALVNAATGEATAVGNGTAMITATTDGVSGSGTLTVSQVATQLVFAVQPRATLAGDTIPLQVAIQDAFGNIVTTASDIVTVSKTPGTGDPAGALLGTTRQPAMNGVAAFADLHVDVSGAGYAIDAASGALPIATSATFDITGVIATVPVAFGPLAAAVNSMTNRIYVADSGAAVSVIDGATNTVLATLTTFITPVEAAVNTVTDKAYVSDADAGQVVPIIGVDVLGKAVSVSRPRGLAVDELGNRVYVAADIGTVAPDPALVPIDGATDQALTGEALPLPGFGVGVAFNPNSRLVYVAIEAAGVVVVADFAKRQAGTIAVGRGPYGVAVNPVTNRIYVSNKADGTVSVIDGATQQVVGLPISVGKAPEGIGVDHVNNRVYVANTGGISVGGTTVSVIDGDKNVVLATLQVGDNPRDVAFNPGNGRLYVPVFFENAVKVVQP